MKTVSIECIKEHEGLRLEAYMPTPKDVPTIGYGHTKGVKMGQKITKEQAEQFLREDLDWSEKAVSKLVKVPLKQNQFDALVDFAYNAGAKNLLNSTLLKKLNEGDYQGAMMQFERWVYAGDKVLPGLVRRRMAEKALFGMPP